MDGYPIQNIVATDIVPGKCSLCDIILASPEAYLRCRVLDTRPQALPEYTGVLPGPFPRRRHLRPRLPLRFFSLFLHPAHPRGAPRPEDAHPAARPRLRHLRLQHFPPFLHRLCSGSARARDRGPAEPRPRFAHHRDARRAPGGGCAPRARRATDVLPFPGELGCALGRRSVHKRDGACRDAPRAGREGNPER